MERTEYTVEVPVAGGGPHRGWFYYCLSCAETEGWIAPVVRG